jgi:citrate lyase beta subunit
MPGDSLRKITKAATELAVDSIVLDLEDGVALNNKEEARKVTIEACQTLDFGPREQLIRINPLSTEFAEADLEAVYQAQPDGIVVPKVGCAEDLKELCQRLTEVEQKNGWEEGRFSLLGLIETAAGVMNLSEIIKATPRLQALMFGAEDLAGDIGARRTAESWEVLYARSAVVTAAAAARIDAIDTLHINFRDDEGLRLSSRQGRDMGYVGKMAIHPRQLPVIHEEFSPSTEEIDYARRLIEAHDAHQAAGTGAFAFEGKMTDMPMIRAAHRVLELAAATSR